MSDVRRSLYRSLIDWLLILGVGVRAAVASPLLDEEAIAEAEQLRNPDFKGWLRGDPMVTMNPASLYGDEATRDC
jgi:hypothetical protein